MELNYQPAQYLDGTELAELRAVAMQPSLEAIGRYDEQRVRQRFLNHFDAENTWKIMDGSRLVGFYVLLKKDDHLYLDHLYLKPSYQGQGLGGEVLKKLMAQALERQQPIRLCALKGSRSNEFYQRFGFRKTHETEFDTYYQHP